MRAGIITIGDEILIGQTIDTNSAWMGKHLNEIGIQITQITSIQDRKEAILSALKEAEQSDNQLILITGGLGPTKDDMTKYVLCEYFNTELVRNEMVLEKIKAFFETRGRKMLEVNKQQADLPKACTVLINNMGTASGMWFERNETIFVSMPGVPYEMKHLMKEQVIPRLEEQFELPAVYHRTIMTEGIGESFLAEQVKDWENSLSQEEIKIAYLPSPGMVRVRLTAEGKTRSSLKKKTDQKAEELKALIPNLIFGENDILMEKALGIALKERNETIATAESCTGGYIAHLLSSIPGSSAYFKGSVVAYDNEVKKQILGVDAENIEKFGAVSQAVVEQMAKNVRIKLAADYGIATSGVAGPDGGSEAKPVGTVWIALATSNGVSSKRFTFEKDRARNIRRASLAALSMLRRSWLMS